MDNLKQYPEMNDEEKEKMWDDIANYLSLPEAERVPQTNKELYESLGLPERTFYDKLRNRKFMRLVVQKSLIQAKKYFPRVISALQKNVEEGKEKSIEMFIKYVGEVADKIDHTTNGKDLPTPLLAYVSSNNSNKESNGNEKTSEVHSGGDISKQDNIDSLIPDPQSTERQETNIN